MGRNGTHGWTQSGRWPQPNAVRRPDPPSGVWLVRPIAAWRGDAVSNSCPGMRGMVVGSAVVAELLGSSRAGSNLCRGFHGRSVRLSYIVRTWQGWPRRERGGPGDPTWRRSEGGSRSLWCWHLDAPPPPRPPPARGGAKGEGPVRSQEHKKGACWTGWRGACNIVSNELCGGKRVIGGERAADGLRAFSRSVAAFAD